MTGFYRQQIHVYFEAETERFYLFGDLSLKTSLNIFLKLCGILSSNTN